MRIILLISFISNICIASDWGKYKYNGFSSFSDEVFNSLNLELEDSGFHPSYLRNLKQNDGLGFNQVYFDDYLNQAIYIKYDVKGSLYFNKLHMQGNNSIYHFKDKDNKIYSLSLIHFSDEQAKKIVYKIKSAILNAKFVHYKNKFLNFFTGSAYARPIPRSDRYEDCVNISHFKILANSKDMQEIYSQSSSGHLMSCLKEIGEGFTAAPKSLYELGKSIYNSAVNISLSKIVDITKNFVGGIKAFSMAIINNWGSLFDLFTGQLKQLFKEIKSALSNISAEQVRIFFCDMIGRIGFTALVALFTGGVASLGVIQKIAKSAKIFFERFKINTNFLDKYLSLKKNIKLESKTIDSKSSYLEHELYLMKNEVESFENMNWFQKLSRRLKNQDVKLTPNEFAKKYKDKINSHVYNVEKEYLARGIPVRMLEDQDGYFYLVFDVDKMKPNTKFSKLILAYQKMYPELDLSKNLIYKPKDMIEFNRAGSFDGITGELNLGVSQLSKLDDNVVDMTLKHELRHAAFLIRKHRGLSSPFDFRFNHFQGKKIKDLGGYEDGLSAEELYTYSKMTRESRILINKYLLEGKTAKATELLAQESKDILEKVSKISEGLIDLSKRTSQILEQALVDKKIDNTQIDSVRKQHHLIA